MTRYADQVNWANPTLWVILIFAAVSLQELNAQSAEDQALAVADLPTASATPIISAVVLPGGPPFTVAFFANDDLDRAENYDTMDLAMFRANEIKRSLLADDWKED